MPVTGAYLSRRSDSIYINIPFAVSLVLLVQTGVGGMRSAISLVKVSTITDPSVPKPGDSHRPPHMASHTQKSLQLESEQFSRAFDQPQSANASVFVCLFHVSFELSNRVEVTVKLHSEKGPCNNQG